MTTLPTAPPQTAVLLGFDPGRDKCGLAVLGFDRTLYLHQVVQSDEAIASVQSLQRQFLIEQVVLGDQTTSKAWKGRLEGALDPPVTIHLVDERYTTLEARDRYWDMFPPQGLTQLIPRGLRSLPRPIDDIVAILLVERYLNSLEIG